MGPRRTRRMGSPAAATRDGLVTISPDQHRGPQRSELEAIRDANASTPQRDNYADDPKFLSGSGMTATQRRFLQ